LRLALSSLVSLGRKTVTGMISASGGQFTDWSSDYRLFWKRRFDAGAMGDVIRRNVVDQLAVCASLVVALDDALLRRSGKKVHGAGWRRDPLGPKFQTNLVWAQRALQASAAVLCGGFTGSARMIPVWFGHVETLAERVESLRRIRGLQDETGGFTAFIPWTFQPGNTALNVETKSGGFDYLRTLAVSRLYLDNVDNIQSSWVTQGPNIAQMALYFGANDMGSTMIEENVVASAGVSFRMSEKDIRRLIEDTGMIPKKRNMRYELLE
jgi:hypothetical protein